MAKLWLYYVIIILLFFSPTFAITSETLPVIYKDASSTNNMSNTMSNSRVLLLNVQDYRPDWQMTSENSKGQEIHFKEDERINNLVQYAYNKCISVLWDKGNDSKRYYSCVNMILTFDSENGAWDKTKVSPTDDWGLCMLHKRWHKDFINSEAFKSDEAQLDYCVGVRQNAMQRNKMPWVAYAGRMKNKSRFIFQ